MIDPNLYSLTRAIHENRIEEALGRQRRGQPPENGLRLYRNLRIDGIENFQETEKQMIPDSLQVLGRERYQTLLAEAEQRRRLKNGAVPQANQATTTEQIRCWLGTKLVKWGFQLQGYREMGLSQLPECVSYTIHSR